MDPRFSSRYPRITIPWGATGRRPLPQKIRHLLDRVEKMVA